MEAGPRSTQEIVFIFSSIFEPAQISLFISVVWEVSTTRGRRPATSQTKPSENMFI